MGPTLPVAARSRSGMVTVLFLLKVLYVDQPLAPRALARA